MLEDPQTDRRRNDPDCPDKKQRIISAVEQMSEAIQDIQHKFSSHLEDYQSDKESTNARLNTLESSADHIAEIKESVAQNTENLAPILEFFNKGITWFEKAERWSLFIVIASLLAGLLSLSIGIETASAFVKGLFALIGIKF